VSEEVNRNWSPLKQQQQQQHLGMSCDGQLLASYYRLSDCLSVCDTVHCD